MRWITRQPRLQQHHTHNINPPGTPTTPSPQAACNTSTSERAPESSLSRAQQSSWTGVVTPLATMDDHLKPEIRCVLITVNACFAVKAAPHVDNVPECISTAQGICICQRRLGPLQIRAGPAHGAHHGDYHPVNLPTIKSLLLLMMMMRCVSLVTALCIQNNVCTAVFEHFV